METWIAVIALIVLLFALDTGPSKRPAKQPVIMLISQPIANTQSRGGSAAGTFLLMLTILVMVGIYLQQL